MILSDVIIHGLTACIAFILQIIIFKVTTQRPLRYWVIILAGIAIFASSYLGILYPKSGFIALVLFLAAKSYKNLRHTILETFFIPFTFALMVRLVIFLIIPIFFPSVLDYYYAGPFILFLAFLLWFAQSALLQVDYSRMMQIDKARPWYRSTSVALCSLAFIYFASELVSTDIHFTIAFLIITALILSKQVNLYRKDLNAQTQAAQEEHSHLLQKSSQNINTWYQKKTSQELFIKDEAENLYDIIRFQQNEEAQELIDYLLTPNPLDKKIDHFYRNKLENIKLPDLQVLFEAKFLKAKELDVWVSMEVPEPITAYPIYPLDWVYILSTILDHVIDQAQDSEQKYLSYAYFKDEDSQHFVVESSSTKEDSAITSDFSDPELKRVNTILSTYPNVNIVSNTRSGIYRLQIEIDMTKGGYNDY